jgi:hypothetical protein
MWRSRRGWTRSSLDGFEYYALLRIQYRLPVLPIALYLRGGTESAASEYKEELFGREQLRFRFRSVALAQLSAEEYVGASPLSAALSALMRRGKNPDALRLRREMLRRVLESGLDDALKHLLVNVIETYFRLSEEDCERFRRLLSKKEKQKMAEVELTYFDELELKGVLKGKRETLLRQLTARFGALPEAMVLKINAVTSASELDTYLDRVVTATSLEGIGLGPQTLLVSQGPNTPRPQDRGQRSRELTLAAGGRRARHERPGGSGGRPPADRSPRSAQSG